MPNIYKIIHARGEKMEYVNLDEMVLLCSMLPVAILFSVMWIYEKDEVLGISAIGTGVCLVGIIAHVAGSRFSEVIRGIGYSIYYLGEAILLVGYFKLMLQRTNKMKEMYRYQRIFFETMGIVLLILTVSGAGLESMPMFLGIWYIGVGILFARWFKEGIINKGVFSTALILHGLIMIRLKLHIESDYKQLIVGILYSTTCVLSAIGLILIYYHTTRKQLHESLSLSDEIMHNTPNVLKKVDCEGNIIYSNKRLKNILGYEEDWIKIGQLKNYVHEKDLDHISQLIESLKPDKASAKFQLRLKHRNGYYIWMGIDVNPIFNKEGIKTGNVVCCKDITTEKITYRDLMKSQRKFYQLFQGIQDAIFIVPFSEDYVYSHFNQFNKAACDNFGYEEEECRHMRLADLDNRFLDNKDTRHGKSYEELLQILLKEQRIVYETEYRTKDGRLIPVEVVDYKFMLNNKAMIMSVVRDISERNIIKEVKALEKVKSEFLANVSHELRTPLNVIIVTLQTLELYIGDVCKEIGREDEKGKHYTEIMKQNALRLLKLVNNFMCMAKIEAGFYETNKQNYNIVSLVEDISNSVITYIEENDITFEFDTDVEEKVVACDVEMIEKIILNLISNAVKFTAPGGLLLININDKQDKVQITVTDSGVGIPKKKQKVVFERFRQADKTFTRKQEGCGIGLSLVKHFVKEHNGTIRLESEAGIGSKFTIELPAFEDENTPYLEYDFDVAGETLYRRALEFSDIINRKVE